MGLIDNLLAAFRGVGQDYKRLAAKVEAMPDPVQDTGWRNVTNILQFPPQLSGTQVFVRRAGDLCYAYIQPPYSPKQTLKVRSREPLPEGLGSKTTSKIPVYSQNHVHVGTFEIDYLGYVSGTYFASQSGAVKADGLITYMPAGPFPNELPGTPAYF